tara:strand:- start:52 stop:504 length:453 start_codon:yes stop_codon:yes gene_type:complete
MITTTNKEELKKFLDAFIWTDCSDEIYLKEDQKEKYQDFVRELHDDEFPNHWRYKMIYLLLDQFVNQYDLEKLYLNEENLEDSLHEIADSLTDVYNNCLALWLNEFNSRGCIDLKNLDMDEPNMTIFDLIGKAQYEAIYSMGYQILNHHY